MSVVLATAGLDHKIRFWEAPSGICSRILKFPDSPVNRIEITPDKQFLAAAGNPVIRLYEIVPTLSATGGASNNANAHININSNGNNNNNNNNVTANISGVTTSLDPSTQHHQQQQQQQQQQQAVLTLEGHTSNVTSIGFQKDGRYLYSGSEDGTVKVWDLRNPHYSRSFDTGGGAAVNSVTLRTDRDELISGDSNGYVKIWDLGGAGGSNTTSSASAAAKQRKRGKGTTAGCGGCINSVKPSAGAIAKPPTSSRNATTKHLKQQQQQHQQHQQQLLNRYNSSNGSTNSARNHHLHHNYHSEGTVPIQAVDISEDSRTLVAVSNHGTVFVWDPSGTNVTAPTSVTSGSLSDAENSFVENSMQNNIVNINGSGGDDDDDEDAIVTASLLRPITKFRAHAPGSFCLHAKIAPDCRHLVTTASDGTAKLWDTTTWELTQTLHAAGTTPASTSGPMQISQQTPHGITPSTTNSTGTTKWVWDAAFCADSSYLVTASSDHVARLWNLRTGDVVRQYHGHQSAVTCVALNDSSV